ncbi:hypothetical protein Tco_0231293 [Tanacetum coccineum]
MTVTKSGVSYQKGREADFSAVVVLADGSYLAGSVLATMDLKMEGAKERTLVFRWTWFRFSLFGERLPDFMPSIKKDVAIVGKGGSSAPIMCGVGILGDVAYSPTWVSYEMISLICLILISNLELVFEWSLDSNGARGYMESRVFWIPSDGIIGIIAHRTPLTLSTQWCVGNGGNQSASQQALIPFVDPNE